MALLELLALRSPKPCLGEDLSASHHLSKNFGRDEGECFCSGEEYFLLREFNSDLGYKTVSRICHEVYEKNFIISRKEVSPLNYKIYLCSLRKLTYLVDVRRSQGRDVCRLEEKHLLLGR